MLVFFQLLVTVLLDLASVLMFRFKLWFSCGSAVVQLFTLSSLWFCSFQTLAAASGGDPVQVVSVIKGWLIQVCELLGAEPARIHEGELAAFSSYAIAYPQNFLPVIDSYSVGG